MKKKLVILSLHLLLENLLFSYYYPECTPETMGSVVPEYESYNANFFAEASALYWHPRLYGTEFAVESLFINDIFINKEDEDGDVEKKLVLKKSSTKGCIRSTNLCWDWGFKVGIGYNLPCYDWNINLNYTAFDSSGSKSTCVPMNNEYIGNVKCFLYNSLIEELKDANPILFLSTFVSKRAKSKIYLNSDSLQLKLGKAFSICEFIVLEPKIGFEYFWITLRQNTRYIAVQPFLFQLADPDKVEEIKAPFFDYVVRDRSKFSGIGPYLSFETQWNLYNNLCFYGNISGALLCGQFKVCNKQKMNINFTVGEFSEEEKKAFTLNNCMNQVLHAFVPSVNTQIGLAYNTSLNCEKIHLIFKLAFDAHYIWRINQMLETENMTSTYKRISEDLSMHGVTLDVRIDF